MNQVNQLFDQLSEYLHQHKLSILLMLSVFIFILSGDALRQIDMTAAPIDLGVLAVLPLSAISVIAFMMLSRWMIVFQWPALHEFQEHYLLNTFKTLLPWQKVLIYFSFYLAVLFSFILVTMSYL